jgi:hypothetical protein
MTALGYRTDTLFANFNRPANDEIARVLVFRESLSGRAQRKARLFC